MQLSSQQEKQGVVFDKTGFINGMNAADRAFLSSSPLTDYSASFPFCQKLFKLGPKLCLQTNKQTKIKNLSLLVSYIYTHKHTLKAFFSSPKFTLTSHLVQLLVHANI